MLEADAPVVSWHSPVLSLSFPCHGFVVVVVVLPRIDPDGSVRAC